MAGSALRCRYDVMDRGLPVEQRPKRDKNGSKIPKSRCESVPDEAPAKTTASPNSRFYFRHPIRRSRASRGDIFSSAEPESQLSHLLICSSSPHPRRSPWHKKSFCDTALAIMSKSPSPHHKDSRSVASKDPWKNEDPFGPPQVHHSSHHGGIKRIRETLSKLSPSAFAEKELLRKKNQYKIPLTHRNVDNFVTEQVCNDACSPIERTPEIQVNEWLAHIS